VILHFVALFTWALFLFNRLII